MAKKRVGIKPPTKEELRKIRESARSDTDGIVGSDGKSGAVVEDEATDADDYNR